MFARDDKTKTYYDILGLASMATPAEIKKAYKELALRFHPDKIAINNISNTEADRLFKELVEAYETLIDPSKRAEYDASLTRESNDSTNKRKQPSPLYRTNNWPDYFFSSNKPLSSSDPNHPLTSWEEWADGHEFLEKLNKPYEHTPGPTAAQRESINELVRDDNAKQLDTYLNQYDFNSEFLLDETQIKNLILAAVQSGSIKMLDYLFDKKGIPEEINKYACTLLANALCNGSFLDDVSKTQRLKLIQYLIEERKLMPTKEELTIIIHKDAQYAGIQINAFLQRYFTDSEPLYNMLTTIATDGLNKLSIQDLFRLHSLNVLIKGKYDDFKDELHCEIKDRNISSEAIVKLASTNNQFKIDALFYYSTFQYKENLEPLKDLIRLGVDLNVEDDHGRSLPWHAYKQCGYYETLKLLIESGADVYKIPTSGKSIYECLKNNREFQAQLAHVYLMPGSLLKRT